MWRGIRDPAIQVRKEITCLHAALVFYTRLPLPRLPGDGAAHISHSIRYLPAAGIVVGLCAAAVYTAGSLLFPHAVAVVLCMITSVCMTGAFHEDGFADVCDGFGGGATTQRKLDIMKDSSLGVYGTLGLLLIHLLKLTLLLSLPPRDTAAAIILVHPLSRMVPVWLMKRLEYVRDAATSKAGVAKSTVSHGAFFTAFVCALLPFAFFRGTFLLVVVLLPLLERTLEYYFKKQIGGYTGDCLGASQQLAEVILYMAVFLVCTYQFFDIPLLP